MKDREAWRVAAHGFAESQTQLSDRMTTGMGVQSWERASN